MSVPKVPKRVKEASVDGGAHAFWKAANIFGNDAIDRSFTGEMTEFGFKPPQKESSLRKFRDAVKASCEFVPKLGADECLSLDELQDRAAAKFDHWAGLPKACFWQHPREETYAITLPYSFSRPYGDASLVLFSFARPADPGDQNKRNAMLGSLDVANQSRLKSADIVRRDSYCAKGNGFGGSFAFAKTREIGGRDQDHQSACGYSLSERDTSRQQSITHVPLLYLEMEYKEVCI